MVEGTTIHQVFRLNGWQVNGINDTEEYKKKIKKKCTGLHRRKHNHCESSRLNDS